MKENDTHVSQFNEDSAHIHLFTHYSARPWQDEDAIREIVLKKAEYHIATVTRRDHPTIKVQHAGVRFELPTTWENGEQTREAWLTTYICILA